MFAARRWPEVTIQVCGQLESSQGGMGGQKNLGYSLAGSKTRPKAPNADVSWPATVGNRSQSAISRIAGYRPFGVTWTEDSGALNRQRDEMMH